LGLGGSVIIDKTWEYIGNFFVRSFFTWEVPWWIGVVLIIIFVGRWWAIRNKESERVEARLLIVLLMGIIALIVHKNPPTHYFGPILLLPTIIVGYWISKLRSGVALAVMASLVLLNCGYILSERYLGKQIAGIGYYEQVRVVEAIKSDAAGRELSIERVGEFDQYDNQAKDNYQYLLIHMGAKLRDKAETGYIISEYIYNGCSDKLEIGRTKNVVICLKGDE
jgi:hypothetical protein